MITKIQKWGNSQGLILAKPVLKEARLSVGEEVEILIKGGLIIVRATARAEKKLCIEDLVARMPRNYHPKEEGFGPAQGKEVW